MPKGGAYLVGRMAGKQFRKARWMWASATGSDDEAIRAEQAVGRDMAAAVREDARGPVDPRAQKRPMTASRLSSYGGTTRNSFTASCPP